MSIVRNKISNGRDRLISDKNLWVKLKKDITHLFIIEIIFCNYKNCQCTFSHCDKYKLSALPW